MFKTLTLVATALTMSAATFIPATSAEAQVRYERGDRYYADSNRGYRGDRGYQQFRGDRNFRGDRQYRGYQNRNFRGCDAGTGGTVVGAIAGGLIGNEVARRGDKTSGALIGGVLGALAGRAIDKSDDPCRRRR